MLPPADCPAAPRAAPLVPLLRVAGGGGGSPRCFRGSLQLNSQRGPAPGRGGQPEEGFPRLCFLLDDAWRGSPLSDETQTQTPPPSQLQQSQGPSPHVGWRRVGRLPWTLPCAPPSHSKRRPGALSAKRPGRSWRARSLSPAGATWPGCASSSLATTAASGAPGAPPPSGQPLQVGAGPHSLSTAPRIPVPWPVTSRHPTRRAPNPPRNGPPG